MGDVGGPVRGGKNSPSKDLGRNVAVAHLAIEVHPAPFRRLQVGFASSGTLIVGCEHRIDHPITTVKK
jgi:hypothetical protein